MIQVLVVDEVRLVCDVIAADLQDEPDLQVVGVATTLEEAVAQAARCQVLLTSTTLPGNGALGLVRTVARHYPHVKVLIMGLAGAKEAILEYIEAGAAGYILQEDSLEDLLQKIRAAASGEALISADIIAAVMARIKELAGSYLGLDGSANAMSSLTAREREVLDLISQGLSNREIADRLTIEIGTVKNHVHSILRKMNANSRRDVIARLSDLEPRPNRLANL